jgi:protein TonB
MFDQSLLAARRTNKPWTLAASLVGQLTFVAILCLTPLVYTDQLHGLTKWADSIMAPPMAPVSPPTQVRQRTTARESYNALRPPVIISKGVTNFTDIPEAPTLEAPATVGVVGAFADSQPGTIAQLLTQLAPKFRPPEPLPPARQDSNERAVTAPVRISEGVLQAKLLRKVVPVYPPLAITARVEGTVRLVGVISKDGTVRDLQVVSGHPLLVRAAVDAVRQWIYQPTLLNHEPVEVVAPITVTFVLNR